MIELDAIPYVLKRHRKLPEQEQLVWILGMMRADASEAVAMLAPGPDASDVEKNVAYSRQGATQLGHSLRSLRGPLVTMGQGVPPVPSALDDRIQWVRAWVPTTWLGELTRAVGTLDDLDPEAE